MVAPEAIQLPEKYLKLIEDSPSTVESREGVADIKDLDILYMTRTQQERFENPADYEAVKDSLVLNRSDLDGAKKNLRVLHPLPRVNELAIDVDTHPSAYYFEQVRNGLYVRQALIETLLLN